MYIRTLIDGLGVYMWQYCIQTCDGSPESQKLRDTLWTQTHWSLNQWQISHDFAGMLHLKWPSFCLKYARTLHEMWFIQWRFFFIYVAWLKLLNDIFSVTFTVGVRVHALCVVHTLAQQAALGGLEITARPVSRWLIRPIWRKERGPSGAVRASERSVGRGYYPESELTVVWAAVGSTAPPHISCCHARVSFCC